LVEPHLQNFERASVLGIRNDFGNCRFVLTTPLSTSALRISPLENLGHGVEPEAYELSGGLLASSR
jgi:hypothetical protein